MTAIDPLATTSRPPCTVRLATPPPAPSVNPTAITNTELAAVRSPPPGPELAGYPALAPQSSRPDGDRITQISGTPALDVERDRVLLLRLDGVEAGRALSLDQTPFSIGRRCSNQLELSDGSVSRTHARITSLNGKHLVEDLASRNGTFVRGQRITQVVLADGDLIQFGSRACFRYTLTDGMHEQLLHQLYDTSTKDALTGAYNRRHLDERLRAELAYAVRHGTALSVVLLDIDHFKQINDSFGHLAGDAVLRHLALTIARQIRGEDVFARYGGEEFLLILRNTSGADATRAAERIRATVAVMSTSFEGRIIPATLSAGCASLSECEGNLAPALVALADARLFEAKRAGRNRIQGPPATAGATVWQPREAPRPGPKPT
jgi:two-component system, cell cycle response regulator